jgi:hypothetical protein
LAIPGSMFCLSSGLQKHVAAGGKTARGHSLKLETWNYPAPDHIPMIW